MINESGKPFKLELSFTADPIPIPNAPSTYMKLFLPADTMTHEKHNFLSYGISELKSLNKATRFQKTVNHNEECLFYIVAVFYQTKSDAEDEGRGGNRAEIILEGKNLIFKMLPQVETLNCGHIIFNE